MSWIMLKDGWRDESSEGPYTETLQTKGNWAIIRLLGDKKFTLKDTSHTVELVDFDTVEAAKAHVAEKDKPAVVKSNEIEMLTNSIRTAEVAALVMENGGDLWGKHPKHSKADWKYEVASGYTMLGYWEWVSCKIMEEEAEDIND
jgi:hypothetical protein